MQEFSKVRKDLSEIRYYYSKKELFDKGAKVVSPSMLLNKVEIYNKAIVKAPAQLYALYIAHYVNCDKQVVIADDWGCTNDHIKILNRKLCEYFQQVLDVK